MFRCPYEVIITSPKHWHRRAFRQFIVNIVYFISGYSIILINPMSPLRAVRDGMKSHRSYFWKPAKEILIVKEHSPTELPNAFSAFPSLD
jgi:hypothetical protein